MHCFCNTRTLAVLMAAALLFGSFAVAEAPKVDPNVPEYEKSSGIAGNLSSIGSDTLNNLMTLWSEGFARFYPGVKIQIEGKEIGRTSCRERV